MQINRKCRDANSMWRKKRRLWTQTHHPAWIEGLDLSAQANLVSSRAASVQWKGAGRFVRRSVSPHIPRHSSASPPQVTLGTSLQVSTTSVCHAQTLQNPPGFEETVSVMYRDGLTLFVDVLGDVCITRAVALHGLWSGTGRCIQGDPSWTAHAPR